MKRGADRHISMAGLSTVHVSGRYPSFSKVGHAEGVVIAVRFIDDERNTSKKYVEYDVRDLSTGQIYRNCRRANVAGGMDDGDDTPLRPAQKLHDNVSAGFNFDPRTAQLSQSDGDRVLVSFIGGAHISPVIIGVLPHNRTSYGSTRADGLRRFTTHKGTSVETKADGTYQVKRDGTTITLNADKTIEVAHESGSKLTFNTDGSVTLIPATTLKLGDDALVALLDGVLTGQTVEPITGLKFSVLGGASSKVLAKNP